MSLLVCSLVVVPLAHELLLDIGPSFRPRVFSRLLRDCSLEPQEPSCACLVSGHFALFYRLVFVSFMTMLALFISSCSTLFKADIIVMIIFIPYHLVPVFHHSALPGSYHPHLCTQHTHTHTHTLSLLPTSFAPSLSLLGSWPALDHPAWTHLTQLRKTVGKYQSSPLPGFGMPWQCCSYTDKRNMH